MRNWRVLTAVLAVVLALLAGLLAWQYLSDADERAEEDAELVDVLVAAEPIPQGTAGADALANDLITEQRVPREAVPAEAVPVDQRENIGGNGLVAAAEIGEGQFIVETSFRQSTAVSGLAGALTEGDQAISFQVDDTRGVGGFLSPGDSINVILNLDVETLSGGPADVPALNTTQFLLPGLEVLAVGDTTAVSTRQTAEGETERRDIPAGIITVRVTSEQALRIVHAQQGGTIHLSLNPTDFEADDFQTVEEVVEAVNLFPGGDAALPRVRQLQQQLAGG